MSYVSVRYGPLCLVARENTGRDDTDLVVVCEAEGPESANDVVRALTKAREGGGVSRPSP